MAGWLAGWIQIFVFLFFIAFEMTRIQRFSLIWGRGWAGLGWPWGC
jgi:hypothetical protein